MIPLTKIQPEDDVIGTVDAGPRHFNMVGVVDNIIHETITVDGIRAPGRTHYVVVWADGSRTLCREHQIRPLTISESAFAEACMTEVLLKVTK